MSGASGEVRLIANFGGTRIKFHAELCTGKDQRILFLVNLYTGAL